MLKRFASKKRVKDYKSYVKRKYKDNIRFVRSFDSIDQVEECYMKNLEDKYPNNVIKDSYVSRRFLWSEAPDHRVEIMSFYRHPSIKYRDVLLMKMVYKVNDANNSRSFIAGEVTYTIPDNSLRKRN